MFARERHVSWGQGAVGGARPARDGEPATREGAVRGEDGAAELAHTPPRDLPDAPVPAAAPTAIARPEPSRVDEPVSTVRAQPSADLPPKKPELDRLFGSMDLDLRSAIPLVTGDLSGTRQVDGTRFPLALLEGAPARSGAASKPAETTRLAKLKGTVDLFLERIEPLITGDFLLSKKTADLEPALKPDDAKRARVRARTEDLVVVDNILGQIDIVLDVRELIEQASTLQGSGSIDVAANDTGELSRMIPDVVAAPLPRDVLHAADPRLRRDDGAGPELDEAATSRAVSDVLRMLDDGRFEEASPAVERLLAQRPTSGELVAASAFVRFSREGDATERFKIATRLAEHAEAHPFCVTSHGFLGRMYLALDRPMAATRVLEVAVELEPDRGELRAELQHARDLVALRQGSSSAVLGSERSRRDRTLGRLDAKSLTWVFVVFAAVWAASFVPAVVLGWGHSEAWLEATDPFPWARGLLLVVVGVLGARSLLAHRPLTAADVALGPEGIAMAIVLGVLAGSILEVRVSSFPMFSVLVVTTFRALSEEVFLRGLVGRALRSTLVGTWTLALVSGLLYALYQLTGAALWESVATSSGALSLALAFATGTAYGLVHAYTRSVAAAALCHLTAAVVLAVASAA